MYEYNDDKFVKSNVRKTREDAKRHSCVYIALSFVRQLWQVGVKISTKLTIFRYK